MERSFPTSEVKGGGERSFPMSKVRGSGRGKLPHVQGAVAALGVGGLRGTIPSSRSEGVAMRRYPSSKVRSSGCALLEQPCRDIPVQSNRNPSKMVGVARGHQRADALKPQLQRTSQSDHRTTVLSNSIKLSHAVWGHPRQSGHGGEF